MATVHFSGFVSRFDDLNVPYRVRKDVDALRNELGLPNSIAFHQAVVLAGQAHFLFDVGDRYVGYADEMSGFTPPD